MVFKLYLLIGFALSSLLWRLLHRWMFRRLRLWMSAPRLFLIDKLTFYLGITLLATVGLRLGGASLGDVLATAGVLTVALGFAAKTSMSQLISGVILLGGKIIQKDDLIEVGSYLGIVENIDVFSTRLRTFDNVLVSIPNEKLLTECVSNYSQYPMRRILCDFIVRFEDIDEPLVDDLYAKLKELDELLVEPEPAVVIESVPGRGLKISVRAWCESAQVISARNQLTLTTARFLKERQVRIPDVVIKEATL